MVTIICKASGDRAWLRSGMAWRTVCDRQFKFVE